MAEREVVRRSEIVAQLRELGVRPDDVLLVHSSFRAVRPVEGGPEGLIEALREALGPGGTLVMPSMSEGDDVIFDPAKTPARWMGAVAETFWRLPGVLRSDHYAAFAAAGPLAARITAPCPLVPPHGPGSPVDRVRELDGRILLLGVDHRSSTTIHLAECLARVPYGVKRHFTVLRNGRPERVDYVETDHCCTKFALVGDWLRDAGLEREGPVGHARALLVRSRDVVEIAVARLRADPFMFLHRPEEGCAECDAARKGVAP